MEKEELLEEFEEELEIKNLLLNKVSNNNNNFSSSSSSSSSITNNNNGNTDLNELRILALTSNSNSTQTNKNKRKQQQESITLLEKKKPKLNSNSTNELIETIIIDSDDDNDDDEQDKQQDKPIEDLEEGEIEDVKIITEETEEGEIINSIDNLLEEGEELELVQPSTNYKPLKADDDFIIVDSTASSSRNNNYSNESVTLLPVLESLELDLDTIKLEAKNIISQLLGFGVTPDYLLEYGVSEDIIAITFSELGYRLPSHLSYLSSPLPLLPVPSSTTSTTSYSNNSSNNLNPSTAATSNFSHSISPRTPNLPLHDPPPPPPHSSNINSTNYLQSTKAGLEMEIQKREELLARKAALSIANKKAAEKAVNFLDDFFSFASTPSTSSADTTITTINTSLSIPSISSSSQSPLHSPSLSSTTSSSLPHNNTTSSLLPDIKRAVAFDFETLPIPSTSSFIHPIISSTTSRISTFVFSQQEAAQSRSLIIDLSDDDDGSGSEEEIEEETDVASTSTFSSGSNNNLITPAINSTKTKSPLVTSNSISSLLANATTSIIPSSRAPSVTISSTRSEELSTERKLLEKEIEIRKVMLKIASMEKKRSSMVLPFNSTSVNGNDISAITSRENSVSLEGSLREKLLNARAIAEE